MIRSILFKVALLISFCCVLPLAHGQFTAVTATIIDNDSIAWAGCSWQVTFVTNGNVSNVDSYQINGVSITSPTYINYLNQQGTCNSSGALAVTLLDNKLISPGGSTWKFTIKPNASVPATTYPNQSITGGFLDLSAYLSANSAPIRFPALGFNSYGYGDVEISPTPLIGGIYFNVTTVTTRQWQGAAGWQNLGTGGGGGGGGTYTGGSGIGVTGSIITNTGATPINVVTQLGLDPSGVVDVSAALNAAIIARGSNQTYYFPCGSTFNINNGIKIVATATTMFNINFESGGYRCVTFNSNGAAPDMVWFDNSQVAAGNQLGPSIGSFTFNDTSGTGAVRSGLRISQYNKFKIVSPYFTNMTGQSTSTGNASVTKGSTSLTCVGCTWTTAMDGGHFWVNGNFQEVNHVTSSTSANLTVPWQFPNAVNAAYSLDYYGIGLMLDGPGAIDQSPPSTGFSQYGTVIDLNASNFRVGVDTIGGLTGSQGTSRVLFLGGYMSGNRVPDSIGLFLGQYTDTVDWYVNSNNNAVGVAIESGHANRIYGHIENTPGSIGFAPVRTCNGGVSLQSCIYGNIINTDSISHGQYNMFFNYVYDVGTANYVVSSQSSKLVFKDQGLSTSNLINYNFFGTTGCPVGTFTTASILNWDCAYIQSFAPNDANALHTNQPGTQYLIGTVRSQSTAIPNGGTNVSSPGFGLVAKILVGATEYDCYVDLQLSAPAPGGINPIVQFVPSGSGCPPGALFNFNLGNMTGTTTFGPGTFKTNDVANIGQNGYNLHSGQSISATNGAGSIITLDYVGSGTTITQAPNPILSSTVAIQRITLNQDMTPVNIPAATNGMCTTIRIAEDAIGGWNWTWPANVTGGEPINTRISAVSKQSFCYNGTSTNWEASTGMSYTLNGEESVTYSATPVYNIGTYSSIITLAGNITSFTLNPGVSGQVHCLIYVQNAVGGYTVTPPANVLGFFTVGATSFKHNQQCFTYSPNQSAWLAQSAGQINF